MDSDPIAAALARIEADRTGAVVTVCRDAARTKPASRGPLAGVPFTVKDVLATKGVPSQAGSRALAGHVPEDDAPAVARLRGAGAVMVGKTNCSELALTPWTGNPLFGETRHPFAPGRSPGGSSGGCAAAIAAGLVPLGLGTDYGGSLRLPAAACGIVALRPSPGRISAAGQLPPAPPQSPRAAFSIVGPLARDIMHLHAALGVLDPSRAMPLPPPDALAPVAIGAGDPLVRAAAEALGCLTGEPPPFLAAAERCFTALRDLDTYDDLRPLADRLGPGLQELIDRAPRTFDGTAHRRLAHEAERLRRRADEFLSAHKLLILPVTRGELPPPAGAPVPFEDLGPSRAISLLGLPAVAAGGVQIVARRGRDEEALATAALLTGRARS
jgi:amidase